MKIEFKSIVSIYHPEAIVTQTHTHKFHEMVYCVEGQGATEMGTRAESFCTGNYYIVRAGTYHKEEQFNASWVYYFHFDAPEEYIIEGTYTDCNGTMFSVVKRLYQESLERLIHKEDMQNSLLTQILIEARRAAELSPSEKILSSILPYINENIENDIDFRVIAKKLNYSYDRFRHIFKANTGFSPYQYLVNARIEKARVLLEQNPSLSLTQIAYNCGFSSSSQFSNIFRTRLGITPSEYKNAKSKPL